MDLTALVAMIPAQYQPYVILVLTATVLLGHILALTGTPKWLPAPVMNLINIVVQNYGKSKNVDTVTTVTNNTQNQ